MYNSDGLQGLLPVAIVPFQMFFLLWHADTLHPRPVHIFQPIACSDEFYLGQDGLGLSQSPAPLQAADYLLVLAHCQTPPHNDHVVNLWMLLYIAILKYYCYIKQLAMHVIINS